nr:polyketide synthase type I [Kibdelosporangium sp. MJ126-NF4]CTQ91370.1 polyketide synthase type I [Kibdelosporangium sp. MJ126-NF4]
MTPSLPFQLVTENPGHWSAVRYRELRRRPPGRGEIEVAVEAAGLNYYDVIKALNLYAVHNGSTEPFGGECVGTVTSVGPAVTAFSPGDSVVACARGAIASHVVARADHARHAPLGWAPAELISLPLVTATAWHGLVELARLDKGETALIHSAAGGVGLAAIQVAHLVGARVIATTGTERKRAELRRKGIADVFDSRCDDWTAQVLAATKGRGVDVVLNSLTGQAMERNLEVLNEDGRYVELSMYDIKRGALLKLDSFTKRLTFCAVDLSGLMRSRPDRFAKTLSRVWDLVMAGQIEALPVTTWPFADATDALREFAKGEHIGKLILTQPDTVRLLDRAVGRSA